MKNLSLPPKLNREIETLILELKKVYSGDLISIALYGSAASGEFISSNSNLNLLILLKSTSLTDLKKSSNIVKKYKNLTPLFLTEEFIASSSDTFPIEFLDMQENYQILYGKDIIKDIRVDLKNLRFQCEQELKIKLLNLKRIYLEMSNRPADLRIPLFKSFNSILHILRNILRLKGIKPPYKKEELLKELSGHFKINDWDKILAAKSKKIMLGKKDIEHLFINFVDNLEEIVKTIDAL